MRFEQHRDLHQIVGATSTEQHRSVSPVITTTLLFECRSIPQDFITVFLSKKQCSHLDFCATSVRRGGRLDDARTTPSPPYARVGCRLAPFISVYASRE